MMNWETTRDPRREKRLAAHVAAILRLLGLDLRQPDLKETPRRVARMYLEIFSGVSPRRRPRLTTFPNKEKYGSMVVVRDIPFYSSCAHHLVPFFGMGHIGYVPADRIVGLSKLARVLEHHARRPQVQERLTEQVADDLDETIRPRGVMVVIEARHLCMEMRGVEKPGALTITSTARGIFREESPAAARLREEFMRHLGRPESGAR